MIGLGNSLMRRVMFPLEIPTRFTEGVDLIVSAVSNAAGALCSCALRGWLEDV